MKKQSHVTTLLPEENESIITQITEKAQSIIDDGGDVIFKLLSESMALESNSCASLECDCIDIDVTFQDGTTVQIPICKYINGEDLNSHNPILNFVNMSLELDMCEVEA